MIPSILLAALTSLSAPVIEHDVAIRMRDGTVLRADVWRPAAAGRFPVLVYRTPYDRRHAQGERSTVARAAERGYAVVVQDVRGRYGSDGEFEPYRNEGRDGCDTIEWAAAQAWSDGTVGTFGLSYPGAVQWLAAVESPPHLKAMAPAMTFSTPRNFFYSGGVFDMSWTAWIWNNIAPDVRVRRGLAGPRTGEEARATWDRMRGSVLSRLPLSALTEFRDVAPYLFVWMSHPPGDPWWDWAELQGRYDRVGAAVLNLSGWHDEAYGPEGALTNFLGLRAARRGQPDARTSLIIGPWVHGGVRDAGEAQSSGDRTSGAAAVIDYDETILRFMDRHVRGLDNGVDREPPVRVFLMGENAWRTGDSWPLPGTTTRTLFLGGGASPARGRLDWRQTAEGSAVSSFTSDPAQPVEDPRAADPGAHDYRQLVERKDVAVFDTPPFESDLRVVGRMSAEVHVSSRDAPDVDIWVKLFDVAPDGTAFNLMSPGLDVVRASYRDGGPRRRLLRPGRVYALPFANLMTGNTFRKGHRLRVVVCGAFFPHFSRNLQTGALETVSAVSRPALIDVHHSPRYPSRLVLPVVSPGPPLPRATAGADPPRALTADRVLLNGRILTVDANDSVAEAVAIKSGRILAVGTSREIEALAGPDTERIDLQGLTATPGLLDAHCHFASGGVDRLLVVNLSYPEVKSIADVVAKLKERAVQTKADGWVLGRGWDEGKLAERRYIYASDLDPISADRPVWLTHTTGHYGAANSVALKLAGITKDTPDPPGGTIDRRPDGTPTGVLKEAALSLVAHLVPPVRAEQWRQAIRSLAAEFNKEGMTGLKDPGIAPEVWDAYQKVLSEGALTVRVFALWAAGDSLDAIRGLIARVGPFTKPYRSTGDDHLVSGGVKFFMDGSGGARTAWLYDEWNRDYREKDAGNRGYPLLEPELMREQIRLCHDAGLHVGVHAIGDRAIDWVVDSYELALARNPIHGLRHAIIHANIPTDHALERMAALQKTYDAAYPEPSATFMWWIGDTYAANFGPERSRRLNPFKTYLERGIRWAGGSDFDVTPFPARYGLWASMARETLLGRYGPDPYGRAEAIDIHHALRSYTRWAARQMFLEDRIGSIEPGKHADIAVWNKDLYGASLADVKDLECQMTLFEGKIVYRAPSAPVTIKGGDRR